LKKLKDLIPPEISYISVAFGLNNGLLKFWSKNGFSAFHINHLKNEQTGEHTCMMINPVKSSKLNFMFCFDEFRS